jgi:hypothetical protein
VLLSLHVNGCRIKSCLSVFCLLLSVKMLHRVHHNHVFHKNLLLKYRFVEYNLNISGCCRVFNSWLLVGLPTGLFPSGFPAKILKNFSFPHAFYMPCLANNLPWFGHPNIFGDEYNLWSSLCSFLLPPVTSSLLDPNMCFQAPSASVAPLTCETKFHVHAKEARKV